MTIRRAIYRWRRRRALLACRAHLQALGYDHGDLLQPRAYGRFLRLLRGIYRQQVQGQRPHALAQHLKAVRVLSSAYDRQLTTTTTQG